MLFATAQNQATQAPLEQDSAITQASGGNGTPDHNPTTDGGASREFWSKALFSVSLLIHGSAYDPTRPATVHDRSSGGFGTSKNANSRMVERTYENKSLIELRQLAKGAVLSLVPHKIMYPDLVKEGVNARVLRELYEELGVKVEPLQNQQPAPINGIVSSAALRQPEGGADEYSPTFTSAQAATEPSTDPQTATLTAANESVPPPTVLDVKKQPSAPNPSLERKDRIAQLLAAKTGRPTPPPSAAAPTPQEAPMMAVPTTSSADMTDVGAAPTSLAPSAIQQEALVPSQAVNVNKSKAQTELVKQKMEQLKREAHARAEASIARARLTTPIANSGVEVSKPLPQFGSVTPLSGSQIPSFASQPAMTSLIPGLFMSSTELTASD